MTALAMILDAAARWPERVAIEEADGTPVTYAQLIARARGFAARIRTVGVVEVPAARSADFVARCLGAWLADRPFAPIDPADPVARRDAIRKRLAAVLRDDLAYIISTSGSSGEPKAVMVGHGGLPALLRAQLAVFQLGPGDRALWLHAPTFDASISDWGTALAAGATLVVPAAIDTGELARRAITHVDLPPALLAALGEPPPALRVVVLGGEACPVERVQALARRVRVVVVYGPTEATICASLAVVDPAAWTRPLIGAPLPGVVFRVIDGELHIGGAGLALGYAGDPLETAVRFVAVDGERLYRTGDRVEAVAGGLAFAGRIDRQVKLRGRRVELDEIDVALRGAPGVRDAASQLRGTVLVAFVDGDALPRALAAWLRERLPAWMIPARIIPGPLPRTSTGKLDHAALAARALPPRRPPHFTEPLAAELAALWCDAVGSDDVLETDRFRDAGGDSLAALMLQAAATAHALPLDPALLAGNPSFVEVLAAARRGAVPGTMTVAECERRGLVARDRALSAIRTAPAPAEPIDLADHENLVEIAPIEPRAPPHYAFGAAVPVVARGGDRDLVLVTGATGLLGPYLVRAWRARDARPLAVLVRDAAHAPAGVEAIRGDLAEPWLGLDEPAWTELAGRVAAIVHAGAVVQLPLDWHAHAATNVDGTAWIARLAREAGAALHHISTLAVFAGTDRPPGRCGRDEVPAPAATAFGGYVQTKIAAEAIARASGARIYRLGLLVGAAPHGQLAMVARGLARLGAAPRAEPGLGFDVTPVEHAARAIAEAAATPGVHHIAGAPASLAQLAPELPVVEPTAWAEQARARLADPDIAMAYLALARTHGPSSRTRPFDLFLATGMDFDVDAPRPIDVAAALARLA